MRRILTLSILLTIGITTQLHSQNSSILNSDFETITWPGISWVSTNNIGVELIVSEDSPISLKNHLSAHSGNHFVNIGGFQDASGLYEASLAQEFNVNTTGIAHLGFYYKYVRESVDPGSYVSILIDGIEIWSIAPHFIVDESEEYVYISVPLGNIEPGQHTFELKAYENPIGGETPMQFNFDDVVFNITPTASMEEERTELSIIYSPGSIQIETTSELNKEAQIELIDLSGKIVASTTTHFITSYTLPIEVYTSGIYILNFKSAGLNTSKKIFIRH